MNELTFELEIKNEYVVDLNSPEFRHRERAFWSIYSILANILERQAYRVLRLKKYRADAAELAKDIVKDLFAKLFDLWIRGDKLPEFKSWNEMERYLRRSLRNALMDSLRSGEYSRTTEIDETIEFAGTQNVEASYVLREAIELAAMEFGSIVRQDLSPRHLRTIVAVVNALEHQSGDEEAARTRMTTAKARAAEDLGVTARSLDNSWSQAISLLKHYFDEKSGTGETEERLKNDAATELMVTIAKSEKFLH
jgi:hypothetical protein